MYRLLYKTFEVTICDLIFFQNVPSFFKTGVVLRLF